MDLVGDCGCWELLVSLVSTEVAGLAKLEGSWA